jgi:hypothetical protein
MSNAFKVAGVSKQNGEFKVRFANDMLRVKVLEKNGHKDIDLIELPREMEKDSIPAYLLSIDFDNGNKEVRACLEAAKDARSDKPAAPKKAANKAKKSTPSLDAIAARAKVAKAPTAVKADPALEDAPF